MIRLLTLLFPVFLLSDTIILDSEKITENGNSFWVISACKDGYRYTIIKTEPVNLLTANQDFELVKGKSVPVPCQLDFKHPSQLQK